VLSFLPLRSSALRTVPLTSLFTLCVASQLVIVQAAEKLSPLSEYVQHEDASFQWTKRREGELAGGKFIELTLTSQRWKDTTWKHQLFVFRPQDLSNGKHAVMMIGGGRWREELAQPIANGSDNLPREAMILAAAANQMKSPVAVLMHVPQQPIFGDMVEDQAISYTFEQFLRTQDSTWPLLLPMVKSAVRAMDAIQAAAKQEWSLDIEHFTVTGASKRGWTTWLTGAVDPRVTAIAPMVIDMLNMQPQMKHQVETWGEFSEQIEDYTRRGLQKHMDSPVGAELRSIVDPYSYREKLTQPKLIMLGTNDRYWPLDALNLYWSGLQGEKRILYVPNNGHGLNDLPRVVGTLVALHREAAGEIKLANLTWEMSQTDGQLEVTIKSDVEPAKVSAWIATSPTKDFRDAKWSSETISAAGGVYKFQQPLPAAGYVAMFGETMYAGDAAPYYFSTNVQIGGGPAKKQ
jgi:PhoPQ-activated pathogenicity-related protein